MGLVRPEVASPRWRPEVRRLSRVEGPLRWRGGGSRVRLRGGFDRRPSWRRRRCGTALACGGGTPLCFPGGPALPEDSSVSLAAVLCPSPPLAGPPSWRGCAPLLASGGPPRLATVADALPPPPGLRAGCGGGHAGRAVVVGDARHGVRVESWGGAPSLATAVGRWGPCPRGDPAREVGSRGAPAGSPRVTRDRHCARGALAVIPRVPPRGGF